MRNQTLLATIAYVAVFSEQGLQSLLVMYFISKKVLSAHTCIYNVYAIVYKMSHIAGRWLLANEIHVLLHQCTVFILRYA